MRPFAVKLSLLVAALRRLRWRHALWGTAAAVLAAVGSLWFADAAVRSSAAGRSHAQVDAVPESRAAVVLGCSRYLPDGRENLYFRHRIAAAVRLYESGKVEYLVVSGDNSRKDYDEPSAMREALMELGVPAERIYRDYAGFRTLDSVVRAQEIFGLDAPVFVSQRFHNQRALYLARSRGMEATAYEAWEPPLRYAMRTRAREVAARAAAVLDMRVLRRQPKYLGEPVLLGGPPS